jgi:3-oxoacyl-[acyl-carrier protein] reductase
MSNLLKDRKVFITGGSRGIGEAVVRSIVKEGGIAGFTYLDSSDRAASVIGASSGRAFGFRADVCESGQMDKAAAEFSSAGPVVGIDGLVINAGIYKRSSIMDLKRSEWDNTIETNLTGAFNTVRSCLGHMKEGSIVVVSSQLAFRGSDYGADYSSSKAGLLGFARSLAKELAPEIRVNSIAPGFVDTDILAGDSPGKRSRRISQVPLGRIATAHDIAQPVVFLLSNMSSYITGATLDINGGLFIH